MSSRFPQGLPNAPKMAAPSEASGSKGKHSHDFSVTDSWKFFPKQVRVKTSANESFFVYLSESPKNNTESKEENEPVSKSTRPAIPGLYADPNSVLVILFLHGAGFSGLSWAPLVEDLNLCLLNTHFVSIDLRGHGRSRNSQSDDDFSFELLSRDVCDVYNALVDAKHVPDNESGKVKLFVVGHSMGGALTAYIGANCRDRLTNMGGTCVIDVVEGSAMDALSGMKNVLRSRPSSFSSAERAVEWSLRSGYIKRRESAKVTMIGQIVPMSDTDTKSKASKPLPLPLGVLQEVEKDDDDDHSVPEMNSKHFYHSTPITHNSEESQPGGSNGSCGCSTPEGTNDNGPFPNCEVLSKDDQSTLVSEGAYTWRIDLFKTEKFWRSWFTGLTNNYLAFNGPKLLILAGVDRLDKDLTVAQMQGKFQMLVLPKAGHAVHEDLPDRVADALATFIQRNKMAPTVETAFNRTSAGC